MADLYTSGLSQRQSRDVFAAALDLIYELRQGWPIETDGRPPLEQAPTVTYERMLKNGEVWCVSVRRIA